MESLPILTIIVPVYNAERYLNKCIESIINQDFKDFELLLINDGSNDDSLTICKKFVKKDSRIKIFNKNNGGVSSARNLGLKKAIGKYIIFIDSDDYVSKDYLSNLYEAVRSTNADLIITGNVKVYEDSNQIVESFQSSFQFISQSRFDDLFVIFNIQKQGSPWGKLFKKNIIQNNNLIFDTNINLGEDIIFILNYLLYAQNVAFLPIANYFYVQREGSLTRTLNSVESEKEGYLKFLSVCKDLNLKYGLSERSIFLLNEWSIIFLDRIKNAILKLKNGKKNYLKLMNWEKLKFYKTYSSKKEYFLDSLLWTNNFNIFILLHYLRSLCQSFLR